MRALTVTVGIAALLLPSVAPVVAHAQSQGYLAFYDVAYTDELREGEIHKVHISFQFDQEIADHDEANATWVGHVFRDVHVNVTFPSFESKGDIFVVGARQPSTVLVVAHPALGDVPIGRRHYDLELDLPATTHYCIELDLDPALFVSPTQYCVPSNWENEALACPLDTPIALRPPPSCLTQLP